MSARARQPKMLEKPWQKQVVELAHRMGWKVAHFHPAMVSNEDGYKRMITPVSADGAGWPDLFLVHPVKKKAIAIECKSDSGKLHPQQQQWGDWLNAAGIQWMCAKPKDLEAVLKLLGQP